MNLGRPTLLLAAALLAATMARGEAVHYELVAVGTPGSANDPATGGIYGGVGYEYRIGKYGVTIGEYAAFLNAVAKTDTLLLSSTSMATDHAVAGISRTGSSGSYAYSVITNGGDSATRPITHLTWWHAALFAN